MFDIKSRNAGERPAAFQPGITLATLSRRRAPRLAGRLGAAGAAAGFAVTAALAVPVYRGEVVAAAAGPLQFAVDRLAVLLLLLVFAVSATAQLFAARYLAGDSRAGWFAVNATLLTAASAGLATAATLVTLAFCWTLAGIALCLLLATYWTLPAARDGVRRAALAFLVGDLALWAAVVLATASWGTIDLRAGGGDWFHGPLSGVIAVLIVIAALSRSAQIPFHRWLPATLAAPTPVSALLHAGVVNAGGILLIRLASLTSDGTARTLTILAGAATVIYGALIMLAKPDVKGALVHSTTAQMGFMILTCGLGLWAAAAIHLVAHGFYKSTLFLSSGSAVAAGRRAKAGPPAGTAPTSAQRLFAAAASVLLPGIALALAAAVVAPHFDSTGHQAAEQALLIFAFLTGAAATWGWMRRRPGLTGLLGAGAVLLPAATAYVGIIKALSGFLAPALPESALPASTVWLIAAVAAAVLAALAAVLRSPRAQWLHAVLYTGALSAGYVPARHTPQPTGVR